MTEENVDPRTFGFWSGLEVGRENRNPLPANPYTLHTVERKQWAEGYIIGRRLGREQREQAEKAVQEYTA